MAAGHNIAHSSGQRVAGYAPTAAGRVWPVSGAKGLAESADGAHHRPYHDYPAVANHSTPKRSTG